MAYFIKMMTGEKFKITDDEFKQLVNATGEVLIKSCLSKINLKMVSAIYPESIADEIEDRKQQQTGVLHDGTRVKRHFGQWVDAFATAMDERGNYVPVVLDPRYYPEVARDCVPTEKEFEKLKALPPQERLKIIIGETKEIADGKVTCIKEILENKK